MNPLLIALLGVLLIPLFVSTWRTSLLGLSAQGLLMAWVAWRLGPEPTSVGEWVTLADLVLVRGVAAPLALYGVLASQHAPARSDVIPPNLLSWTLALGMVVVAFNFASALVPHHGTQQTLVAVATAGVLLGFLVLASQAAPFSQMVGLLRIENAIALFELGGERKHEPLSLQLGQIAVVAVTIGMYRWYLTMLTGPQAAVPDITPEEPTL